MAKGIKQPFWDKARHGTPCSSWFGAKQQARPPELSSLALVLACILWPCLFGPGSIWYKSLRQVICRFMWKGIMDSKLVALSISMRSWMVQAHGSTAICLCNSALRGMPLYFSFFPAGTPPLTNLWKQGSRYRFGVLPTIRGKWCIATLYPDHIQWLMRNLCFSPVRNAWCCPFFHPHAWLRSCCTRLWPSWNACRNIHVAYP
jgi:hypothetical protein